MINIKKNRMKFENLFGFLNKNNISNIYNGRNIIR